MGGGVLPDASVIASWPAANYKDPQTLDRSPEILFSILGFLALAVFGARIYARAVKLRNMGPDDWMMLVAVVLSVATAIVSVIVLRIDQLDRHIWDVEPQYYIPIRKVEIATEILYFYSAGTIKLSIYLFYLRFTNTPVTKAYRYVTWGCIVFVILTMVSLTITLFLTCRPFHAMWDQVNFVWLASNPSYQCFNEGAQIVSTNSLSIAQDFIAALLPIGLFWKVQIPLKQKVMLVGIFALGLVTCATGVVRTRYIYIVYFEKNDLTWDAAHALLWSIIELFFGIICASVPALKIFFTKPGTVKSTSYNSSQANYTMQPYTPTSPLDEYHREKRVLSLSQKDSESLFGNDNILSNGFAAVELETPLARPLQLSRLEMLGDVHVQKQIEVVACEGHDEETRLAPRGGSRNADYFAGFERRV